MDRSSSSNTTEEWQPELLDWYRFSPPDDKMAKLLKKKTEGKHSPINHKPWGDICGITNQVVLLFLSFFKELMQGLAIIPVIDVYKFDAWDLPERLFPDSPYQATEWFAYSRPDYKYSHSSSTCNRTTKNGFWKVTTRPRRIDSESGTCFKKTMTFHEGRVSKSKNTGWVMQEYYFSETEAGCYPNQQKRAIVLCRLRRNKPAKNKSDSKKLKDTLMCEELFDAPAGTGTRKRRRYTSANLDSVEHLVPEEQGDVLNGNGNHHECYDSPNSSCHSNDVLTVDDETDGSIFSGLDFQAALDKKFEEYSALINGGMDHERLQPPDPPQSHSPPQPYQPPHPPQQPQPQDYCSSKLSSPHKELANVPGVYYGDGSKVKSSFGEDNSHLTVTNSFSTSHQNVPMSNDVHNLQNGASDERIPEQPKDNLGLNFPEFQLEDITPTSMSPMNIELGDLCMSI